MLPKLTNMAFNWFHTSFLIVLILGQITHSVHGSKVWELSDRFMDMKHDGQWYIMFYAPWCGHCKRTEPIWSHVAQSLVNTNILVGKIDCSRFTLAAQHYKVNSYPTIMFIKGDQEYIYNGDRVRDDMIAFAYRMSGPPVQQVTQMESFDMLKTQNELFFSYVGPRNGSLWNNYYTIAEHFQPHAYFYTTNRDIASQHFHINNVPVVLVYKENNHFHFPMSSDHQEIEEQFLNETLYNWINEERFLTFPKVTRSNIYQISQTQKFLVLAVVEENKLNEIASHELEFRDMIETIIRQKYDKYHKRFQFGWIGTPDIAHSIVMDQLATPHLIVLNTTTYEHYIPDDEPERLTIDAIELFLHNIHHDKIRAYGGNSFVIRIYRTYFEMKRFLVEMWHGNPILTAVLFGLPLGFLSLIMYSIFCADILDADEEDDEDGGHEKNE